MSIMTSTSDFYLKPIKKYVLQQSNSILNISPEEDQKLLATLIKKNKEMLERENQRDLQKKSEAKKLRSIRHELSSLKNGAKIPKAPIKEFLVQEPRVVEDKKKQKPPRPIVPNYVTNSSGISTRRVKQITQNLVPLSSQKLLAPKPGRIVNISKRNARERNRVKMVNEGYATLRNHIPECMLKFQIDENGKKTTKKFSKVETLRMALDYIRFLESLLDFKSVDESQLNNEPQPWETPNPIEPYSPEYQQSCLDSPGTSYDQALEYQDRVFYEYDSNFKNGLPIEERLPVYEVLNLATTDSNSSVDDYKYYETFNKLKESDSEKLEEKAENLVNIKKEPEEEPLPLISPKVVIKKEAKKKTVLPPITESFSKGIRVFF